MADKVADDERDEVIQRLLKEPENKVSIVIMNLTLCNRYALIVVVKILNGVVPILQFSYALIVQVHTEVMEYTLVLFDPLKWINGRKLSLDKWS